MKTVLYTAFAGFCATIAALSPVLAQESGPRAAIVGVDAVILQPLSQTTAVIGRLVPLQRGIVAAATVGPVGQVAVDVGDRVVAGDLIVQINDNRIRETRNLYAAQVGQAQAKVETAEAELALAEQELQRLAKLKSSAAFSPARYDDQVKQVATSQSLVSEAEAAVFSAQSELRRSQIDVDRARITAPFSGAVVEKHTEVGAYLSIGDPVVTLVNDSDLEIEADVPTGQIAGLTVGRPVTATLSDGTQFEAFVRAVIPEENALTRTRAVRFTMAFPPESATPAMGPLAVGQTATVQVPVGEMRSVVTVHKDAILTRGDTKSVFAVVDGAVQSRAVSIGIAVGDRLEILAGVQQGELVVIRGNERLVPGQKVTWPGAPGTADEAAVVESVDING